MLAGRRFVPTTRVIMHGKRRLQQRTSKRAATRWLARDSRDSKIPGFADTYERVEIAQGIKDFLGQRHGSPGPPGTSRRTTPTPKPSYQRALR